jgi:hypothetical protein
MKKKKSNLEIKAQKYKPKYPQPHNIKDVVAEDPYQRMIFILKQHSRLKQEARYGNRNGKSDGQTNQQSKYRKSTPNKRLPYD